MMQQLSAGRICSAGSPWSEGMFLCCLPAATEPRRLPGIARNRRPARHCADVIKERCAMMVHNGDNPMARSSARPKVESFNFRVDPKLKAAFTAATADEDKPAGQVLRDFMRRYVEHRRQRAFELEARQQSRLIAERGADPASDEAEIMRWIDNVSDAEGWTAL